MPFARLITVLYGRDWVQRCGLGWDATPPPPLFPRIRVGARDAVAAELRPVIVVRDLCELRDALRMLDLRSTYKACRFLSLPMMKHDDLWEEQLCPPPKDPRCTPPHQQFYDISGSPSALCWRPGSRFSRSRHSVPSPRWRPRRPSISAPHHHLPYWRAVPSPTPVRPLSAATSGSLRVPPSQDFRRVTKPPVPPTWRTASRSTPRTISSRPPIAPRADRRS